MKKKAGGQIGCDHLFSEMNFKAVLRMSARIALPHVPDAFALGISISVVRDLWSTVVHSVSPCLEFLTQEGDFMPETSKTRGQV